MNRPKQTIEESVNKIKFMMNYDSNKTLTEQGILGGNIPADAPAYTAASDAPPKGQDQQRGSSYRAFGPMDKLINYYETYRDILEKTPRGVGDDVIQDHAKKLFDNMQGLGMNHKMIPAVFEDMKTPSDVIALIDTFNSTYGQKEDLKSWVTHEWTSRDVQMRTATALKNIVLNYQKQAAQPAQTDQTTQTTQPTATAGYKEVTGTPDDPYRLNTSGEGIKTVQGLLGLVQDGKFGPKTQAALAPLGLQTFTNEDIPAIQAKMGNKSQQFTAPETAPTTQLQPKVGLNPKIPTQNLAGNNLIKPQVKTA